ncbi:MAG: hypothetical protein B7Y36_04370 [Novosphingobium sp. 28-62-57]|uniref:DUF4167 domain-containing protein n=1 Tax=Novosphingobium sp. TaxID=1874826 RepID=UPI000BCDD6EA|nr:DUF4167 domain-containing protein [Novosphingobium sp.]OYW50607.1 MAG: hypothetical protein B7Z34_04035 [Novosphingobium sp. 12-62-10]OYZ11410.1 MAG: hypothetical protein B7Y36_04370 [Novosphingobium sp. 28-62-57]OZA32720.1 MAG: hypothetical protein B7X92_12255 [Novosphingobium sp. 17-62-9]
MNNNRGNNNRRRGRNNNRPQNGGGQQLNRIDSRARGNAPQLLEKYRKLAQDAHMNGDRVQAEYYLQFADHYFRVIADTRVRQDEQRARPAGGANGERWQEQDGEDDSGDFSVEGDFLGFDRPATRREREEQREDRPERAERPDRPERAERPDGRRDRDERPREDRPREDRARDERPREDRPREDRQREERNDGRRDGNRRFDRNRNRDAEAPAAETLPGEGVPAIEGEPIVQASDNPFVREPRSTRGLRPRTERRPRNEAAADAAADEAPATLDASFLPPSISAKSEPEAAPVAEDAAPAPKKRGRPRKVVATEASEPVEG